MYPYLFILLSSHFIGCYCSVAVNQFYQGLEDGSIEYTAVSVGALNSKSTAIFCYKALCGSRGPQQSLSYVIGDVGLNENMNSCFYESSDYDPTIHPSWYAINLPANYCDANVKQYINGVLSGTIKTTPVSVGDISAQSVATSCYQNYCNRQQPQPKLSSIVGASISSSEVECMLVEQGVHYDPMKHPTWFAINLPENYCNSNVSQYVLGVMSGEIEVTAVSVGALNMKPLAISCFKRLCAHTGPQPLTSYAVGVPVDQTHLECLYVEAGSKYDPMQHPNWYSLILPTNYCSPPVYDAILEMVNIPQNTSFVIPLPSQLTPQHTNSLTLAPTPTTLPASTPALTPAQQYNQGVVNGSIESTSVSVGALNSKSSAITCYQKLCAISTGSQSLYSYIIGVAVNSSYSECITKEDSDYDPTLHPTWYAINLPNNYCDDNVKQYILGVLSGTIKSTSVSVGAANMESVATICYNNFCKRTGAQPTLSNIVSVPITSSFNICILVKQGAGYDPTVHPTWYSINLPNNYCNTNVKQYVLGVISGKIASTSAQTV